MSVNQENETDELHQIEIDFVAAHMRGETLRDWIERYPERAVALTDLAIALDLEAEGCFEVPDAGELAATKQALTRARNHVFGTPPSPSSPGLVARAAALGYPISELAQALHLGGDILFKLDHGMIQIDTLPRRLIQQLAVALKWGVDMATIGLAGQQPTPTHYSADSAPQRKQQQSFLEALSDSGATSEQHRGEWLAILRTERLEH